MRITIVRSRALQFRIHPEDVLATCDAQGSVYALYPRYVHDDPGSESWHAICLIVGGCAGVRSARRIRRCDIEENRIPVSPVFHSLARAAAALALATGLATAAAAQGAAPALVLTRGAAAADSVEFTLEELAQIPQVTVVTENEFTDGPVVYRGPLMRDVLAYLELDQAETVRVFAANDYYVDIPTSDFHRYTVILALEADGARLSRREKGPLWVMYPISDHPELRDPVYNARLIWQVVRIEPI